MEKIWRLASAGTTKEDYARDVYIKSNLATQISVTLERLKESGDIDLILDEHISKNCGDLLSAIEATFIHGLKKKLSINNVLASSTKRSTLLNKEHELDFWPVVLILSHNQVSDRLMNLRYIESDIGRCRAWIRLALNDGLLNSYLAALINDVSLLHGFYRPSAYLRDFEHMELLRSFLQVLDNIVFQLNFDHQYLNVWPKDTLKLVGIKPEQAPLPVMTGLDALDMLDEKKKRPRRKKRFQVNDDCDDGGEGRKSDQQKSDDQNEQKSHLGELNLENKVNQNLDSSPESIEENTVIEHLDYNQSGQRKLSESRSAKIDIPKPLSSIYDKCDDDQIETSSTGGNSITKDAWSSVPSDVDTSFSADSLYQSNSTKAVNLSSTPDVTDLNKIISSTDHQVNNQTKKSNTSSGNNKHTDAVEQTKINLTQFLFKRKKKTEEVGTREFLSYLPYIRNEFGLDKQDYKCYQCGRPIGVVYGKSRLCTFDGYHYCLECHLNERSSIPSRMIHNWDFNKYPVSTNNHNKLLLLDNEPIFDIKSQSPLLYQTITGMKECLYLRTQLFFLHAYLFTCHEKVAFQLKRFVWPREHLYEHIHLYSCFDLNQVESGHLQAHLQKAVEMSRKHVLSCKLCSQKGFICEICKNPEIIYPFDCDHTGRCDKCKAVYHRTCIVKDQQQLRPCPRCLRIQRRERIKITDED